MLGDGGIARPRRGVRLPLVLRPPGTGGRRRGAAGACDCIGVDERYMLAMTRWARQEDEGTPTVYIYGGDFGQLARVLQIGG